MSVGTSLLLLAIAFGVIGWYKGREWLHIIRSFRAWYATQGAAVVAAGVPLSGLPPFPATPDAPSARVSSFQAPAPTDMTVLAGAGRALQYPPSDLRVSIAELDRRAPTKQYAFPLGWFAGAHNPALVTGALVEDINHILISGFTDSGKDNTVLSWLFTLTHRYTPQQLQIAFLDGKGGLSLNGWHTKQHSFLFAKEPEQIAGAMQAVMEERKRRQRILWAARCEKWEEYPGTDLPLLIVYVSELTMLQSAVSRNELGEWLNQELAGCRSAGIRYIIGVQNATKLDTRWRSQIGLHVAGYQQSQDGDEPNTGLGPKALRALGTAPSGVVVGVPPSELPAPPLGAGVFTLVQGRHVITVRMPYMNRAQRIWWLGHLPERANPDELVEQFWGAAPVTTDAPAPPRDWRDAGFEPLPAAPTPAPQPVIAFAAKTEAPLGYEPVDLATLLAGTKLKDLPSQPLFVTACTAAYARHRSYRGVITEFWGSYSGSREDVVKEALRQEQALPATRSLAAAA